MYQLVIAIILHFYHITVIIILSTPQMS